MSKCGCMLYHSLLAEAVSGWVMLHVAVPILCCKWLLAFFLLAAICSGRKRLIWATELWVFEVSCKALAASPDCQPWCTCRRSAGICGRARLQGTQPQDRTFGRWLVHMGKRVPNLITCVPGRGAPSGLRACPRAFCTRGVSLHTSLRQ